MDDLSDERLLTVALEGEPDALAMLVKRHQSALTGYLDRLVGPDWSLAQDLCQETFVRVLRQSTPRGERPFKPWLYTIATNLARDHYKSSAVRASIRLSESHVALLRDDAPGPEDHAIQAERRSALVAAVSSLSPEYRAALLLRFWCSMSLQEIADILQIPLGTVKSRLSEGLRRLRVQMTTLETLGEGAK